MPKIDPRNAPGTVVHAAKAYLSNTIYCLTFLQGVVVRASDGKEGGVKCMQWKLNVKFSLLNQEGAVFQTKNVDILRMHCILGPVSVGKNPTYMSFTDSMHKLDHFVKSRVANDSINIGVMTTAAAAVRVPQGNMATTAAAAAAARVSLSRATVLLGAADSDDNSKEIKVCPAVVAADAIADTTVTAVAVSKRKKVIDAASLPSAAALKKSRTAKEGKKDPLVSLFQFPTYVVTNDCKKHCVHAITHGRKWVAGNMKTINGSVAK
jgi:hypothetical protein